MRRRSSGVIVLCARGDKAEFEEAFARKVSRGETKAELRKIEIVYPTILSGADTRAAEAEMARIRRVG